MKTSQNDETLIFTLTLQETLELINALDFYPRIWMGQFDAIEWRLRDSFCLEDNYWEKQPVILELLHKARAAAFPELAHRDIHASWGIWSDKTDAVSSGRAAAAYDMQQAIRYETAWHRNPEGGATTWFNDPMFKGRLPPVSCSCSGRTDKSFSCTITAHAASADLMCEALRISAFMANNLILAVLSCFTASTEALAAVRELEPIIAEWATRSDASRIARITRTIASVDSKIQRAVSQQDEKVLTDV